MNRQSTPELDTVVSRAATSDNCAIKRTLTTLSGNTQKLDGGAMFGNAPRSLWQRWFPADEQNRIELGCRALLVREDTRNVLVEAGIGTFFSPEFKERYGVEESRHVLLDKLAALGLGDADIDVIVLTHLHFDHAGGLLAPWEEGRPPRLLFPNARYLTGHRQWQRARQPHARDRASWIHLPITMRCDCGAERLIDEKTTLLEDLLARNGRLVFTHDPQVAIGRISRDSKGRFGLSESAEDVVALTE